MRSELSQMILGSQGEVRGPKGRAHVLCYRKLEQHLELRGSRLEMADLGAQVDRDRLLHR